MIARSLLAWLALLFLVAPALSVLAQDEEDKPKYPVPTAEEKKKIKTLLEKLRMPLKLLEAKKVYDRSRGANTSDADRDADAGKDAKALIEDLVTKILDMRTRIKRLRPNAFEGKLDPKAWRKKLASVDPKKAVAGLKGRFAQLQKKYYSLINVESPDVTGVPKDKQAEAIRKAREERERHLKDQAAYWKMLAAFNTGKRKAVAHLRAFQSKAIPQVAVVLPKAQFAEGATLLTLVKNVPDDPRAHKAVVRWFQAQTFSDRLEVSAVVKDFVAINPPDAVQALARGLEKTIFENKIYFLSGLYHAGKKSREDAGPAVDAILAFLRTTGPEMLQVAVNNLNRFLKHKNTPQSQKHKIISQVKVIALNPRFVKVAPAIASALGRSRSPLAVRPLISLLAHSNANVRYAAIRGLGILGKIAAEAVSDLKGIVDSDFQSLKARVAAILAIGLLGNVEPVYDLIELLVAEQKPLRDAALQSLRKLTKLDFRYNVPRWRAEWEKELIRRESE